MRKLSHDQFQPEVPSPQPAPSKSPVAPAPRESSNAPTHEAGVSNPHHGTFTATKLATASAAILSELPMPDATADPSTNTPATSGLSKNQLKKIKRKAEWEAGREDRKAVRRAKDREKKLRKRAQRDEAKANAAQNKNGEHDHRNGTQNQTNASQKFQKWQQKQNRVRLPISFVLDCSFDKLMTDGEIISMGSQLTRCYSDNTKAPYACHLYISSWTPETELRKRFDGLMRGMYRNWKGVTFIEQDFVEAGKLAHTAMTGPSGGKMAGMFSKHQDTTEPIATSTDEPSITPASPKEPTTTTTASDPSSPTLPTPTSPQTIYLTSDSPHTLTELTPYTTYIIGGLVDKNRHKSICYNTAVARGIPTAKLPLAEYMQMTSRQVLTTNHVVEIMLRWLEVGDWGDAFLNVLPKRKGAVLKGKEEDEEGEGERSAGEDSYSDGQSEGEGEDGDDRGYDSSIDINVTEDRDATKPEDEVKA